MRDHIEVLNKIKSEYVAECSDCGDCGDCDDKRICFDFSAIQALNKAIKALEQEPSEDCISREWLLNAFGLSEKTLKYGGDHSGYDTLMLYEIQDVIEDAPSVVPKAKEGEWIAKDGVFYCNCCDNDSAGLSEEDVYLYKFPLPNYCPYCGARMKSIKLDCELLKEVCHILKELKESKE